ncbi:unnamed protein product [Psylliodes chrysocephalus]|uniref:Myb/SANT-like DNA-binding domain-containing protein n=1 Tax=Psylliodes chrysocephalus TaxID=3402493 RepID=A0A9P0CZA7_9CUCU|nr:unnamed protein product [Psylliodes chrysocephala]
MSSQEIFNFNQFDVSSDSQYSLSSDFPPSPSPKDMSEVNTDGEDVVPTTATTTQEDNDEEKLQYLLSTVIPAGAFSIDCGLNPKQFFNAAVGLTEDLKEFLSFPSESALATVPSVVQSEQIMFNANIDSENQYMHWTDITTNALIHVYKEHYKKVGKSIKIQKKLFEIIADVLNKRYKLALTRERVNNKWKTLERNFKNVVDNNNKTGRKRKYFKFEKEIEEEFLKQKKINPDILLSEDTVVDNSTVRQESQKKNAIPKKNKKNKTNLQGLVHKKK